MNDISILTNSLDRFGISYSKDQIDKLYRFYEMLIEKNAVMNLTAITDFEGVMMKHFVDSLAILKYINIQDDAKVLDIGTGAGFPGIPLKILLPNVDFVLLDAVNKKLRFIKDVIEELGLERIDVIHARAEDLAHLKEYREKFDFVVSRAVANLATLTELSLPFVKKNGYFIPYKSALVDEEILKATHAIRVTGGKYEKVQKFSLPGYSDERNFVFIRKGVNTPSAYPRKAGLPAKKPL